MTKHSSSKMNPQIKAKLFEVATAEFTDHGFEQASLNRIIGSIGMSKSSFYHFFANKTDLFQQILEQTLAPMQAIALAFDLDSLNAENYWPSIIGSSKHASSLVIEAPQLIEVGRMFFRNKDSAEHACADLMTGTIGFVSQLLDRGQNLGAIRDDIPPNLLINIVMALGMEVDRYGFENMADFDAEQIDAYNEMAFGLFMRLLQPEGK